MIFIVNSLFFDSPFRIDIPRWDSLPVVFVWRKVTNVLHEILVEYKRAIYSQ